MKKILAMGIIACGLLAGNASADFINKSGFEVTAGTFTFEDQSSGSTIGINSHLQTNLFVDNLYGGITSSIEYVDPNVEAVNNGIAVDLGGIVSYNIMKDLDVHASYTYSMVYLEMDAPEGSALSYDADLYKGSTAGVGISYALTDNVGLSAKYRYSDLESDETGESVKADRYTAGLSLKF